MFGLFVRAALYAPVAWVLAYIISEVGKPMLDIMKQGPRGSNAEVVGYLEPVLDNVLFVFIIALLIMLLAGAVRERSVGGGL